MLFSEGGVGFWRRCAHSFPRAHAVLLAAPPSPWQLPPRHARVRPLTPPPPPHTHISPPHTHAHDRSDTVLAALKIKSVGDLAKWKYAVWADALVAMAAAENAEGGSR